MSGKAKIYTRTGDSGKTRLVDGSCVEKFNPRVEAYGTVDELNAWIGELRARCREAGSWLSELEGRLERVQNELFVLGSHLACDKEETRAMLPALPEDFVDRLEREIDEMEENLPPLRNFILPDGGPCARAAHLARTVCRRAERRCAEMLSDDRETETRALRYLNRLSDYLFVAARFSQARTGGSDVIWKAP